MVRFSFASPSKQSRKDRLEQAKRAAADSDQGRRRNFGFLKTGGEKRMSSRTMDRTREHAKQLALAYSDPIEPIMEADTPTSVNSDQYLLGFNTTATAAATTTTAAATENFDPFGTNTAGATNDFDAFGINSNQPSNSHSRLDQHFGGSSSHSLTTPSTVSSTADTSSYDMDFLSSRGSTVFPEPSSATKTKKNTQSLGQFVENTRTPQKGVGSLSGLSADRSARTQQRSVISMPTLPTNSSMQSSFPKNSPPQYSKSPTQTNAGVSAAAARRRMRNQMRQGSGVSANSSFDDTSSFTSSMTPESSTSSKNLKNRLGPYQRGQSGSFYSQASVSSQHSGSNVSGSDSHTNLFDSQVIDGGFTFDAFGLDQSQVEREVNEAMKDLAGQGISGFSAFFNNNDSDSEFPSQNWDSPANSRRSSPAPSDSESEGFVDGFRVSPAQPARPVYQSSSPMTRKMPKPMPRGAATPPRWEAKSSNLRKPQVFDQALSNPWKDDPWGSGDERAFSDSGTESDFGGTKSEIVTSFQAPARPVANFSDTRSDVGTPTAYQKSVSFREDVVLPDPEPQLDDSNSSSGEENAMQAELAQEFAQEFVRRISPRHANSEPPRHSPRYSDASQNSGSYRFHNQPSATPPPRQEEQFPADFEDSGAASDYSEQQSFGAHDESHETYEEDPYRRQAYGYGPQHTTPPAPEPTNSNTVSQFGSFRSKYDSSRSPSVPKQDVEEPTPVATTAQGSFRSSYTAAKNRAAPSWQDSEGSIAESSNSRIEEKKEEELPKPATGNLKAKWKQWESKTRVEESPKPATPTVPKWKRPNQETPYKATLRKTPTDDGPSVSQNRATECAEERGSFASLRERLKSSSVREEISTKSDIGTSYRSPVLASVADRYRRESPRTEATSDSRSDTGASPSFLSNVRRRSPSAASSPLANEGSAGKPLSYRERQFQQQREAQVEEAVPPSPHATPTPRKLTYRERREMELKREQEAKEKLQAVEAKGGPKKDVASLIRRRIAANKQKTTQASGENKPQVADFRSNLKPVVRPGQSPRHEESSSASEIMTSQPAASSHSQTVPSPRFQSNSLRQPLHQEEDGPDDETPLDAAAPTSNAQYAPESFHNNNGPPSPRRQPSPRAPAPAPAPMMTEEEQPAPAPKKKVAAANNIAALFAGRSASPAPPVQRPAPEPAAAPEATPAKKPVAAKVDSKGDVKALLSGFLGARQNPLARIPAPKKEEDAETLEYARRIQETSPEKKDMSEMITPPPPASVTGSEHPALKDDPKYERYFRMLKVGMPMDVVKHAMQKDGADPSVMDGDHNKPAGLPLKEDPKYTKYFKMLKIGIPMGQVKHSMERDGLNPDVMDQDHSLPASACEKKAKKEPKQKDTHRRARLHWKTLVKVTRNSLWSKIEKEPEGTEIDFDEEEFKELFQADVTDSLMEKKSSSSHKKKGAAVRVIDAKRANNGGIILARVKMSHDQMADVVDRIDGDALSAEQIENIIEFLPTKEERKQLEKYMLEGGQDAAEKFDGLCECEKFMVSMMTVKHAKRKVRALLFKLQFLNCLQSIAEDAGLIEDACEQLKNSTRLRQLLGIVLQFGNRLNTAGKSSKNKAGAFTLDSLLKLSQAKAFDKKTTFLHYIVMIVNRNNPTLLNFTDDLTIVMKADKVYWDQCLQDLEEVENQLENVRRISLHEARLKKQNAYGRNQDDDESLGDMELTLEEEVGALRATPTGLFTLSAIKQVSALRDKVELTRTKFVRLLDYFGADNDTMQPHELFNIFCTFGRDFNKAKEETFAKLKKKQREDRKKAGLANTPDGKRGKKPPANDRKALRASSMQPNMSKVIEDLREHMPSPASTPRRNQVGVEPTPSPRHQNFQKPKSPSYRANAETRAEAVPPAPAPYSARQQPHQQQFIPSTPPTHISPKRTTYSPNNMPPDTVSGYSPQNAPYQSYTPPNPAVAAAAASPKRSTYSPKNMPYSAYKPGSQAPTPDAKSPSRSAYSPQPVSYRPQESPVHQANDVTASSPVVSHSREPSRESAATESLRQKARNRRQRQMQVSSSSPAAVSGAGMNQSIDYTNAAPEYRSPRSSPNVADEGSQRSTTSRSSMRSRRLQAMKRVSAARSNNSSHLRSTN